MAFTLGYSTLRWREPALEAALNVDFPAKRNALENIGYSRVVTACPGDPPPCVSDAVSEAKRSKAMADYLRGIGY